MWLLPGSSENASHNGLLTTNNGLFYMPTNPKQKTTQEKAFQPETQTSEQHGSVHDALGVF